MAGTRSVPQFWIDEIHCGKVLGMGAFCEVLGVEDIFLTSGEKSSEPGRYGLAERFARARRRPKPSEQEAHKIAIYGKPMGRPKEIDDPAMEPPPHLALKRVRIEHLSTDDLLIAQEDLYREFQILSLLRQPQEDDPNAPTRQHPNIIELFGIGWNDRGGGDRETIYSPTDDLKPSFLLLSRLQTTLSKRLSKWKIDRGFGMLETLSLGTGQRRNQWVERVLLLSKVTRALQHLHSHHILYRDVKPDNIGFDAMDVPRLFDFGLARKINDMVRFRNGEELEDGLYHLTPETGTLRYMSIENGKGRPYGWSSDVYSLGILMHEVLSLRVPFGAIVSPRQFRDIVWTQGRGLQIDPSWPEPLKNLLPRMWHHDPLARPTIHEIGETLDEMLRGKDNNMFPKALVPLTKRSLFMFKKIIK
jgi:serine/threonine protein kinase